MKISKGWVMKEIRAIITMAMNRYSPEELEFIELKPVEVHNEFGEYVDTYPHLMIVFRD